MKRPTKRQRDEQTARAVVKAARRYVLCLAREAFALRYWSAGSAEQKRLQTSDALYELISRVEELKGGAW